jgi:hypothetical protein
MNEQSARPGKRTLAAEVSGVSIRGIWLLVDGRELFMSFRHFPYFRDATIAEVLNVRRPYAWHLRWPRLDVDLELESIEHPERYPLVDRVLRSRVREASLRRREARSAARAKPATRGARRASH